MRRRKGDVTRSTLCLMKYRKYITLVSIRSDTKVSADVSVDSVIQDRMKPKNKDEAAELVFCG